MVHGDKVPTEADREAMAAIVKAAGDLMKEKTMIKATIKYSIGEEPSRGGDILVDVEPGHDTGVIALRIMQGGAGGGECLPEGVIVFDPSSAAELLSALMSKAVDAGPQT